MKFHRKIIDYILEYRRFTKTDSFKQNMTIRIDLNNTKENNELILYRSYDIVNNKNEQN